MTLQGTMAVDYEERIDFSRLRDKRLDRCLEAMAGEGRDAPLDALMLGKPSNSRYAAGFRHLYTAGKRAFSPSVIVVRQTRELHIFNNSTDGVPPSIPFDHLHPVYLDPANTTARIKAILGPLARGRIGVDAMSPAYAELFQREMPNATFVDGERLMRRVRAVKTRDEIECLKLSLAVTESAMYRVVELMRPGLRERQLVGVFDQGIADLGVTIPAVDGTFCVIPRTRAEVFPLPPNVAPFRELVDDRILHDGDLVALSSGAIYMGYASDFGRTWVCGSSGPTPPQRELFRRWAEVCQAMEAACRPGNTAADIRRAASAFGLFPSRPMAHGIGLGFEPPVIGLDLGEEFDESWVLQPGMVLTLQPYVWREGVGGVLGKETVLISKDGPQRLSNFPYGPLAS